MDAIVGVWLSSLVGAAAFSAAGYLLGQRGVMIPLLGLATPSERATTPGAQPTTKPSAPPRVDSAPPTVRGPGSAARSKDVKPPATETAAALAETPIRTLSAAQVVNHEDEDEDEERTTLVPDILSKAAAVASTSSTLPPPRSPSIRVDMMELEATKADLKAALAKADAAAQRARTAEAMKSELERQIESLRSELRNEVVARATASARADELGDRLAGASEEASSLRHKVSVLDKQARQLREALQGRVRALTTSEWHRRRDLEEAEEMRLKLRDVYEKLERSSLPPTTASMPPSNGALLPPAMATRSMPSMPSMPPNGAEELHAEIARLTQENRDLRARALGTTTRKQPSRGSVPELDLDVYRDLIDRIGAVGGLKGAVVADEIGSLLAGGGELAEGLAAFGAYIRDASSRTERLLPLEGVAEVDIRDRNGMLLCTRVITHAPSEVSLVLLGAADASLAAAKQIVEEQLRFRS
jgi:hypothetical protein